MNRGPLLLRCLSLLPRHSFQGSGTVHFARLVRSLKVQREKDIRIQAALSTLKDVMPRTPEPLHWWQSRKTHIYALSFIAFILGVGIWYEVYEISRYGIVTFACPVKVNIGVWVGLSQLLCLANLLGRPVLFDIRTIHPRARNAVPGSLIVLRCPRDTSLRWVFQTFTAITSFFLYAYGTVLLASMTLIPASDGVRALVVLTASAGFGRLVGYWLTRPRRRGRQILVIDVPPDCLSDFASSIIEQF